MSTVKNSTTQTRPLIINGHYQVVQKYSDGNWYYKDDFGKLVKVDPNDLFGINQHITESTDGYVAAWQKQLDKDDELIEKLQNEEKALKSQLKTAKEEQRKYFAQLGVKEVDEIQSGAKRQKAEKYMSKVSKTSRELSSNGSQLFSAYITAFCDTLSAGKAKMMQSFMNQRIV